MADDGDRRSETGLAARRLKALVVDDDELSLALSNSLEAEGFAVQRAYTQRQARALLRSLPFDLVVSEGTLPDGDGESLFRESLPYLKSAPFIFTVAQAQLDQAVRVTKAGALDYVAKPYDAPVLAQRIREIVEARRAPKAAAPEPRMRSAAMLALGERLTRLASTNVSLLLVGETGSGKRQIGRTFHQLSARNREPFIEIRCGALAGADADRILFGETLARQEHGERTSISGALEKAGAGTLFLHHIEEMPPAVQTKLIQVIDEKKFHRVGDFANDIPFGARLISSSDLASAELKKKISPDLVYRLAVVELRTPPLRNRQEDIELLIHDLLRECAAELGVDLPQVDSEAVSAARLHNWPGNLHELRSRLLRALTLGSGKKIVTADMFPEFEAGEDAKPAIVHLDEARAAAEREQILRTLAASSGRIGEAASRLGISRVTLWTKMKRLGLHQGGEEASPAAEQ